VVEDGGEPMNVFRDPEKNQRIDVPPRTGELTLEWPGEKGGFMRRITSSYKHSPVVTEFTERFHGKEALQGPVH
jgi:hypothetical protein